MKRIGKVITGIEAFNKVTKLKNEAEEIIAKALEAGEKIPTIFNLFGEIYNATHLGIEDPLPDETLGFQRVTDKNHTFVDITVTYKRARIATISQSYDGTSVLATPGDFEVIKNKEPLTWAVCALLLNEILAYFTDSFYAGDGTVLAYIGEEFKGIDMTEDGSKDFAQYYLPVTDTVVWVYDDPHKNETYQD